MLYNKYWVNCYEELIAQYPQFYRGVLEMEAILKAYGWCMDRAEEGIEKIVGNAFIQTADEDTITSLELFLDLAVNKAFPLEDRRALLLLYFAGLTKVNEPFIVSTMRSLTGATFTVELRRYDEEGNHALYIVGLRKDVLTINAKAVQKNVLRRLPAHLLVFCGMLYTYEELGVFTYEELEKMTYYQLENAVPFELAK